MDRSPERPRVLVVDDDPISRRIALSVLGEAGYEGMEAVDGKSGLSKAFTLKPDCVLLDGRLPDMDGLDVLEKLRGHFFTTHIPVVMVTGRAALDDRVSGLERGADDYVTKPYDRRELMARLSAVLRRSSASLAADPLTKLPGNAVIRDELQKRLEDGAGGSVAYVDLDNFKAYVDAYGFEAASRVIQQTARLMYNAVVDDGEPQDFIGHIGGDDFLVLGATESVARVCANLVDAFGKMAPSWYGDEDVARGHIEGPDRYGVVRQFPLVSLSVAIIDVPPGTTPDPVRLARFAAACKGDVKQSGGNVCRHFTYVES